MLYLGQAEATPTGGGGFRLKISEKTLGDGSVYHFKLTLCSNLVRGVISLHVTCRPTITLLPSRDTPDYTKYASLVDKPQNEFSSYFCEAKRIILLPGHSMLMPKQIATSRPAAGNLRDAIIFELCHSSATRCRGTSLFTSPCCEDDVSV